MGKTVETKRKKKGRPSLLDLQKRSLRLQQQQKNRNPNPNPSPSPNPYVRFPVTGHRRTRRNRIPDPESDVHEEEPEDEETHIIGKRREKKLKLVLRIHDHSSKSPRHLGSSSSESEQDGSGLRTRRKIQAVGADGYRFKADMHSSMKAMESLRAEASNPGPTTPLPDKKLLFFILDILQKKDTYRVFSEPVDPEELPDYHEVIKNPMDFSTVRKKLSRGAYGNLEQFEKDVFLISSNAMRYNAPDTIYYRQARTILDLAKKNFENLRQESDKEPEAKTVVRRGRPPSKNINRPLGFPQAELTGFSSDPTLAIGRGAASLSSAATDMPGTTDASAKVSYGLRSSNSFGSIRTNKVDVREDYSGFAKEIATRFGKRAAVVEENRRNTYSQFQPYSYGCEMPILSVFDGDKKQLIAVGLHMEYAYARSLARFAAHLGSIGWSIAADKIKKVLPPGTKYGRGWVGENESPQLSQPQIQSSSPSNQSSPAIMSPCTEILKCSNGHSQKLQPSSSDMAAPACDGGSSDHGDDSEDQSAIQIGGAGNEVDPIIQPKTPFQVHWNRTNSTKHPTVNGFTPGFRFNPPSQGGIMTSSLRPPMCFDSEPPIIHVREHDMALRNSCTASAAALIPTQSSHTDSETAGTANHSTSFISKPVREHDHDSQCRSPSMQGKSEPIPPDLNVRFQSPGSSSPGVVVDSQQPDLALQL